MPIIMPMHSYIDNNVCFPPLGVDTGTGEAANKVPENVGAAESKPQPAPPAKPEPLKSDPNKPGEHGVIILFPKPFTLRKKS